MNSNNNNNNMNNNNMNNNNMNNNNNNNNNNTKRLSSIVFIIILSCIFTVFAKPITAVGDNLTFTADRSEYYFLVGEEAQLNIQVTNDYNKDISGIMTDTITQKINTQNSIMQSTSSNSQNFNIKANMSSFGIGLGTSGSPSELGLSLTYSYSEPNGKQMQTSLVGIKVFFVEDKNATQQNNQQNSQQSTTKSQDQLKEEYQKQQEEKQQQLDEQMRQQMKEQEQANKLNNRMQNNQGYQDSNALKQEMQKKLQEQDEMKQQFKKAIEQNAEFQKKLNDIIQKGFNQTGAELNPTANNSGDFSVNFQDKNMNNLTLHGKMENNTIKNMQEVNNFENDYLKEIIEKDERFKRYNQQLTQNNYMQNNWSFEHKANETRVSIPYNNQNNQTAYIKVILNNTDIVSMTIQKTNNLKWILISVLIILTIAAAGYFAYYKYFKKQKISLNNEKPITERCFDYKKEARRLLDKAIELFERDEHKEAYSKASQAVRIYYSYKLGVKKEITSTELIDLLKKNKIDFLETQKCLNMCNLVEFARYEPIKKDFDEIIRLAEKSIK
jgi:HEPN domain-containing protein